MRMVKIVLNNVEGLARVVREYDMFGEPALDVVILERMEMPNGYVVSEGTQTWVFNYQVKKDVSTRH